MAQVRGFLTAISQQENERDARLLSLVTIAARADSRSLEKTFDQLLDHARPNQD